jgi:hypothetical protein
LSGPRSLRWGHAASLRYRCGSSRCARAGVDQALSRLLWAPQTREQAGQADQGDLVPTAGRQRCVHLPRKQRGRTCGPSDQTPCVVALARVAGRDMWGRKLVAGDQTQADLAGGSSCSRTPRLRPSRRREGCLTSDGVRWQMQRVGRHDRARLAAPSCRQQQMHARRVGQPGQVQFAAVAWSRPASKRVSGVDGLGMHTRERTTGVRTAV